MDLPGLCTTRILPDLPGNFKRNKAIDKHRHLHYNYPAHVVETQCPSVTVVQPEAKPF